MSAPADEIDMTCIHGNPIGQCLHQITRGCGTWDNLMADFLTMRANAGGTTTHDTPDHLRAEQLDALGLIKDTGHGPDWTSWKVTHKGTTWEPST